MSLSPPSPHSPDPDAREASDPTSGTAEIARAGGQIPEVIDAGGARALTTPGDQPLDVRGRRPLVFCGMCGALNPAESFYCAACGTTLVDAFHATEGLRVYEQPDSASRMIEIVPSGTELDIVEDPNAPEDFVRVRLHYGRLGYVRLQDVATMAEVPRGPGDPDSAAELAINTNARGCVSSTGALASIALVVVLAILMLIVMERSSIYDQGTLAIVFCLGLGPLLVMTIAFYLYARGREDRIARMTEDDE
ncbi:MAG: SH3 domain-containing protein [Thermomicrobiales bacterium]